MATAKKKNAGKQGKSTQKRKKQVQAETSVKIEIFLWIVLAVSVVLLISNFGVGGSVGNAISSFFFGLVGLVCYPLPIFLFLGTAFVIANKRNPRAYRKIVGFILLFLAVCLFLQLITEGTVYESNLLTYYQVSAKYKTGGGLLGGTLSRFLVQAFGTVGTYVITIIVMMISLVLITQKSMFDMIQKCSQIIYQDVLAKKEKKQEALKVSQEEQEKQQKQLERKEKRKERTEDCLKETEDTKKRKREQKISKDNQSVTEETKTDNVFLEKPFVPENAFPIHRSEELVQDIEEIVPVVKEEKEASGKNPRSSKEDIQQGIKEVDEEIALKELEIKRTYEFPPIELLKKGKQTEGDSDAHLRETAGKLQETLYNFGVNVSITNVSCGPTVTRYELQPEQGVKVSKIVGLTDDIKLNLAATDIRIEAPIPGKAAVGIEVPNENNSMVMLRDLLQSELFVNCKSKLSFAVGKDIAGKPVITDIAKMPHLLIAGATGSGKSVCINTIIISLLYKSSPDDVKLIMIDPKVVELSVYNGIPHLFIPVVTDPKKAAGALNWAVAEMTDRYNKFAEYNVRDLKGYNKKVDSISDFEEENKPKKLPQIVIIVDELADLMMVAPGEVEDSICRLAQLARAAGIHLIIATQRPSVNVITGLIKANMPSRIAFSVSSGVDSRTILDMNGAEKLLGKGDMLFYPQGYQKPIRVQGAFISDKEVGDVVEFLAKQNPTTEYNQEIQEKMEAVKEMTTTESDTLNSKDVYFADAGKFIIEKDKASIGMLQRTFKIGFNRAARIMDQLFEAGVVGDEEGTKPRKVLMSKEEFEQYIDEYL